MSPNVASINVCHHLIMSDRLQLLLSLLLLLLLGLRTFFNHSIQQLKTILLYRAINLPAIFV